jgi:hypothetical protein
MRNRKRTYTIIGAFLLLFVVGIVYAATTGTLNLTGIAGFNTNVRLNIIDESITSEGTGENVGVNPAGDTLTFTVHMNSPGETRHVNFKIENVGNADAILGTLTAPSPAPESGITVVWPTLNGVVVDTGATMPESGEYTAAITWDSNFPEVTQDVNLSASINYSEHITP